MGISRNIFKTTNYNFHFGFDALIIFYRRFRYENTNYQYDNSAVLVNYSRLLVTGSDAFSAGISAFMGTDIRIYKNIYLGADFSDAFIYTNIYGEQVNELNSYIPSSPVLMQSGTPGYKRYGFSNIGASFNLSYLF